VAGRPTAVTFDEPAPCPVCGGAAEPWAQTTDVEYRTSQQIWHYARCRVCATLFLLEPPQDRLAEIYPANYYSYSSERSLAVRIKEWLDRRTLRALCSAIPGERLRLLDVGGGVGAMASLARRIEPRITESVIVDLDDRAAPIAEASGHRFVTSRIEDFDEGSPFDVVLMLNLIEHVADPVSVLAGARRLTSRHGRVLVKTPNVEALDAKVLRHRNWGGYHAPRHWVLFTPETFRCVAEQAGFAVERLNLTQGGPFWAVGVLSLLEQRGLVRRRPGEAMVQRRLFGALAAGFAAFDLLRAKVGGRTSQMFVELRTAPHDEMSRRA
jgi:SAM-dependent methyltransferase